MENLSRDLEHSPALSKIVDMLHQTCDKLVQAISWSFDTLTHYGTQAIQGVSRGVQTLFVDVVVRLLNKIAILVKELYQDWSAYAQQTIDYYRHNLELLGQKSNFFQQHFAWRVEEIFQH